MRPGWQSCTGKCDRTDCKKCAHRGTRFTRTIIGVAVLPGMRRRRCTVHRAAAFCKWDRHISGYTLLLDWPCQLVYTNTHSLPIPKHLKKPAWLLLVFSWCMDSGFPSYRPAFFTFLFQPSRYFVEASKTSIY